MGQEKNVAFLGTLQATLCGVPHSKHHRALHLTFYSVFVLLDPCHTRVRVSPNTAGSRPSVLSLGLCPLPPFPIPYHTRVFRLLAETPQWIGFDIKQCAVLGTHQCTVSDTSQCTIYLTLRNALYSHWTRQSTVHHTRHFVITTFDSEDEDAFFILDASERL